MSFHDFSFNQNNLGPLQSKAIIMQGGGGGGGGGGGRGDGDGYTSIFDQQKQLLDSGINPISGDNINPSFFQKGGGAGIALGAVQTLGSLWNSFQQTKIAKKSLNLQTRAFETNLANQTQSYNTALEDRINARYATEGRSGEAAGYIERNKL